MEDSRLSIGEVARASGLPVSALRFYDGAGVLVPASVDPRTGYRRYGPDQVAAARLIARLRRVGLPLASVRALLAGADPGPVLDAHLARLEDGLAAARRELSAVRALLDRSEPVMTQPATPPATQPATQPASPPATRPATQPASPPATRPAILSAILSVPAAELAAALASVRYAAGTDPAHPALHGVLLDADGGTLHVVATDRYRLAVAAVPAEGSLRALLPTAFVAEVLALPRAGAASVTVSGDVVEVAAGDRSARATALPDDYPDWRRLEPAPAPHQVPVDGPAFRAALAAGPAVRKDREGVGYDAVVLTLGADGELTVGGTGDVLTAGDVLQVGVNRDFLLDALGSHDQLVLELDGPITPLAIRLPDGADWSLLMPVSLADPA